MINIRNILLCMERWVVLVWGYILITTALGKALEVASRVAKVEGVESACVVTGAFDVIATFDVESLEDVGSIIVEGIHLIEGVYATQTAICVSSK